MTEGKAILKFSPFSAMIPLAPPAIIFAISPILSLTVSFNSEIVSLSILEVILQATSLEKVTATTPFAFPASPIVPETSALGEPVCLMKGLAL